MSSPGPSNSKIAIPRLPQRRAEPYRKDSVVRPDRVSRACANCRARKIKCNAAKPSCSNCSLSGTTCIYPSSRRDRLKTATGQNKELIELLQSLRSQVSEGSRDQIDNVLASVFDDVSDAAKSLRQLNRQQDQAEYETEGDRQPAGSGQASGTNLATTAEKAHMYHSTQTAARATEHANGPRLRPVILRSDSTRTDSTGFFLDNDILDLDIEVNPFEMPSFREANDLFRSYLETSHNLFPLLAKKAFTGDFNDYYAALESGMSYQPSREWQVQVNLVFAIASVHRLFGSSTGSENGREHLVYHSRALALNEKKPLWFSRPSLPQMQITGLLSFYYLSTGFVERSWALTGLALRFGFAIGLHNRSDDPCPAAARKEELGRIWWAHFALERLLAAMTGRPSIGVVKTCSVPLPLSLSAEDLEDSIVESRTNVIKSFPADQVPVPHEGSSDWQQRTNPDVSNLSLEPANSGSYLKSLVQLSEITQEALTLYRAGSVEQRWLDVQEGIKILTSDLDKWISTLPTGLNSLESGTDMPDRYARERGSLDILYHGTIILVTRPFLCRLDRLNSTQTVDSNELSKRCALTCVESAKAVAKFFPENQDIDLTSLYKVGPWWNMAHTLLQSFTVLLLEIVYEPLQLPHNRREIMQCLRNLLRWLRAMQLNSLVAARAYMIVMKVVRTLVATGKVAVTDLLGEDEQASSTARSSERHLSALDKAQESFGSRRTFDQPMSTGASSRRPADPAPTCSPESMTSTTTSHSTMNPCERQGPSRRESIDTSSYLDPVFEQSGTGTPALSGLFVTIFDEGNPLSKLRLGAADVV